MTTTHQLATDPVNYGTATQPGDDRRQFSRSRLGGLKISAAFLGWLCAHGFVVLLLAVAGAAVAFAGVLPEIESQLRQASETVGIVGAALLLLVYALAHFCGGYVAGGLARFDGRRQAFAVWILGVLVAGALAVAGTLTGVVDDVPAGFDVELPWEALQAMVGGLVVLGVSLVVTLLASLAGGKAGERYQRRIDRDLLNLL